MSKIPFILLIILGFDWQERLYYASNYFDKLYQYAIDLIKQGKAYVCDLTADQIRAHRGTLTEPGKESPNRNRSVDENLNLFERMKNGEFADGTKVLRAKIDMSSPNINMRDPVIYRIRKEEHPMTSNKWCIYPMYDYTHCISDALERITHSICTLEFEDHRPLYDWCLNQLDVPCHPQQIEFAKLNLNYTVMSKRKLLELVEGKFVQGWDDPRLPTLQGLRRRGLTPESIRDFCERIGVAKRDSCVDMGLLEFCIREDLEKKAPRVMAVLRPLKVVLENYPEGQVEELETPFHQNAPTLGARKIPFSKVLYVEKDDFMENPPKDYHRLAPGTEVRLRYAYIIKCEKAIKDPKSGEVIELRCSYDPNTKSGTPGSGKKVKGIMHWVSADHSLPAEVRLYDRLFTVSNPSGEETKDYKEFLNPKSLEIISDARVERSLVHTAPESHFQFERLGYFYSDAKDHNADAKKLVFNRTVTLKDSWGKQA